MIEGASALERAGADMLLICTNTMHKLADEVAAAISIPIIHIADIAAAAIKRTPSRRPLLLATRFTMEEPFYRGRMLERHGLDLIRPEPEDERAVHDIIYRELCQGVVEPGSKARCLDIIEAARTRGADGVILGCTELDLLLSQADSDLPVFDTTALHAAGCRRAFSRRPSGRRTDENRLTCTAPPRSRSARPFATNGRSTGPS